ncbi:MAG: VanZ family protein [Phycisphaerales bacterium]
MSTRVTTSRATGDAAAGLTLLGICVVFVTLYPFGFVRTGEVFIEQLRKSATDPFDLFLPLHAIPAVLAIWLARASFPRCRALVIVIGIAFFLLALELIQVAVRYRHARLGDVLVQWVGLGAGAWMYPFVSRWFGWLRKAATPAFALALIAITVLASFVVVRGQQGHNIAEWDESFPLMLGDEYKGGRPWSGTIHHAGIYAGKTDSPEHGEFEHSMVYDLAQGPESTGTIDFTLRTKNIVYSESGLDLDLGTYAQGTRPASEMSSAIQGAGAATIAIDCTPTLTEQLGPARILTISKGLDVRNITAAQEGDAFVLRVRTPRSGKNGTDFQAVWPGVFESGRRVRIVATTTGGRTRLWVDGTDLGEQEHVSQLGDWLKIRSRGKSWIAGVVLFAPIGLIATRLSRKVLIGITLGVLAGSIPIGLALWTAHSMTLTLPIPAAIIGGLCVAAGLLGGMVIKLCSGISDSPKVIEEGGAE